jgi:5'-nucleotidase/UDP-sugar diphosphatase
MLRPSAGPQIVVVLIAMLSVSCASAPRTGAAAGGDATVVFAHINDVYEIDAIAGGAFGGMARAATVFNRLRADAAPVVTTLGGDFLSPSALGTARIDGEPVAGRQMVEVLNAIGLQWATLGNHEFDVPEAAFRKRMAEAAFKVVVSNVTDSDGRPFPNTVESAIVNVQAGGREIRIGLIGLVINSNSKPWVRYEPPIPAARAQVAALQGKVDAIVALTHLALASDQALVEAVPEIDLVLGGHEHENWYLRRGDAFAPIVKADANVRSVAVVTMRFPRGVSRPAVSATFELLDRQVPFEPRTQALVKHWTDVCFDAFRRDGFEPDSVVVSVAEALDGREATVRRRAGALTSLIADAIRREARADIGLLNGGSIRIDDVLPPGPVRQYDLIRILPFGGTVLRATIDGSLLLRVLNAGVENAGSGGFLHWSGITLGDQGWLVNDKPLNVGSSYVVGMPEFLLTGGETRLGFLTRDDPGVRDVQALRDIRQALITEMKAKYGGGSGFFRDRLQRVAGRPRE